ncbi:hypothetical protein BOKEGFJH_00689 [Chlamydia avium]|uniref:Uncharacterized protein n=2 Tax=Chlamydia avium TaxID=1457141 RepID=W8JH90_9CHLA|nr:phage holin family protein [Chlamydia avium]AHK63565.1 Uncharacterized protein M832_07140 [Chlamydia avium 10DC88]EPP36147.1 hypothetical protein CP10743SC13_0055 [Chlamydia psittaci 10_743_SC13]EPP38493.1 hypothetical protein CP10881SC42_0142 [Chlamydia avium]VVT43154.1 hypothetical protein BOKEGFJH_00689 [Chlamydia avium]
MPFAKEAEAQRTCWKCEGSVSMHMPQCPYCSAFLQDPPVTPGGFSSCHISFPEGSTKEETEDLFAVSSEDWEAVLSDQNTFQKPDEKIVTDWKWLQHWPLAALFLGSGLLVFALVMLLFGNDEGLTLSWPKNRVYFYGIMGAILAYRGYRKLS